MLIKKQLLFIGFIILLTLIIRCENKERFYRPDLPEQICGIGIIDIDDTTTYDIPYDICQSVRVSPLSFARLLMFEKSFQPEFPEEMNDSLREFSFFIFDGERNIFSHQASQIGKKLNIVLPDNIKFESGREYSFYAHEKESPEISAKCIVPELPPVISLVSIRTGISILDETDEGSCRHFHDGIQTNFTRRYADLEFSFPNINPESYYAILVTGSMSDTKVDWSSGCGSVLKNFDLIETNTNGFFYPLVGRNTRKEIWVHGPHGCYNEFPKDTLYVYFFESSKIYDAICTFKISVQWDWLKFPPDFIKCFRIRLMSIPKEAYLFQKSLYSTKVRNEDPFAELININGNIVNGNGVIALCRSRELFVYTGQTGGPWDPFF